MTDEHNARQDVDDNATTQVPDTNTAIDALRSNDPAEAPDIAEGIASGLQRELDDEQAGGSNRMDQPL